MKRSRLTWIVRVIAVVCITAMILLAATSMVEPRALSANAQPVFQDATQYPPLIPTWTIDYGYPIVTDTAPAPNPTAQTTAQPTLQFTIQPTALPQITLTLPPNTFLTENAEMGTSQATIDPNLTPGITVTATITSTPAPPTPQPTPILPKVDSDSPGGLNWGFFWIGFSLPVLAGCGWVLYLLDRRPDLFRSRG